MLRGELSEVVAASDVVVLGSSSPAVIEALSGQLRAGQRVVDLVGLKDPARLPVAVTGLCW
jgi:hypothetical protein